MKYYIRRSYYSAWNTIIDQEIEFDKRVMHPPDNMMNTLISFVNTIIYSKVLTEIFKPLIGDRVIFSLLNRNQITEKSFEKELNYLHLTKKASQIIMQEIDSCMIRTITHKELGRNVSYQYLIRLEAYKLVKHLLGEKEYSGFEIWW